MEGSTATLLSDANRQVQIADHLLSSTYPMVKDPKLLLSVVEHGRRALEDAMRAVVQHHVEKGEYELPKAVTDASAAFPDLTHIRRLGLPSEQEAIALLRESRATLQEHKESPTTFTRDEKLVIADDGFSHIKEVTPADLKRGMVTIKQFVHGANQHVVKT